MPRGYKRYLHRYGDGVVPRSTFYRHMNRLRQALVNQNMQVPVAEWEAEHYNNYSVITTNDVTFVQSPMINHAEIIVQNSHMLRMDVNPEIYEADNTISEDHEYSQLHTENSKQFRDERNTWLYDDYDEEAREEEIWFDAEEAPSVEYFHENFDDEHYEDIFDKNKAEDMYNQPLCNCTSITRGEALLMTLLLGAEESLTWKTITAILLLINTLFSNKVVLDSKFKLFKTLELNEDIISYHLFCNDCLFYFGGQNKFDSKGLTCRNCGNIDRPSNISYFITLCMKTQLNTILHDPEVQQALFEHFQNTNRISGMSTIANITNGKLYKKLLAANNSSSNSYNLTYTFNTDGCQKSKSSKVSTWPIFAVINELPIKLQKKHMIMSGIWANENEPNMQLFMKPFVNEANELSEKGIEWTLRDKVVSSKFIPICAVVDSVARSKILNMKQFNGIYGCTFCEHPTEAVDGLRKYTISTAIPADRTDESIKKNMELAGQSAYGTNIMGIWGPSALMNLKYFDIADGMSPDYMHAFLMGAVKQHTNILLSSFGEEYYVGNPNQLKVIDERLMNFKHPTCITRSSRSLMDREIWKASEWRSWLLLYSLISLKGILPEKYLNHLALLVEALNIMLSEKIKPEELRTAGFLLIRYVVLYQEYFGKEAMTYNIHLLLHMERSVFNLGPLWCHNTFIFENENHFILKMQKSPTHLALQIARRYIFEKSLSSLEKKLLKSDGFKIFCERNLTGRLKNAFEVNGCTLIGKGKEYELNTNEQGLVDRMKKCLSFTKFIYNSNRYTSTNYRFCQKIDDSLIVLKNGKIGIIKNICYFDSETRKEIYIFYQEIIVLEEYFHQTSQVTVHNIQKCIVSRNLCLSKPEMIKQPCMLTKIQDQYYIIQIPEGCCKND